MLKLIIQSHIAVCDGFLYANITLYKTLFSYFPFSYYILLYVNWNIFTGGKYDRINSACFGRRLGGIILYWVKVVYYYFKYQNGNYRLDPIINCSEIRIINKIVFLDLILNYFQHLDCQGGIRMIPTFKLKWKINTKL